MGTRSGILEALPVSSLMSRRVALVIGVVGAFLALTAVASADAGNSHAKFNATSGVFAVGPSDLLGVPTAEGSSTDIVVKRHKKNGNVTDVSVNTVNEAVANNPFASVATNVDFATCDASDGGAACFAVAALVQGSSILSLHTSDAELSKVGPDPYASAVLTAAVGGAYNVETYAGELKGKLNGAFVMTGLVGPLAGEARLNIKGTATYACFGFGGTVPLPDITACEAGAPGTLFLPVILNVVDKGNFTIEPEPGTAIAGPAHELDKLTGKLEVTVNGAFGQVLGGSLIDITKAKARFVVPSGGLPPDPTPGI
jgi:hypothetical protein